MKRRLYFILSDSKSASQLMDDLLLARLDSNCIHFHADSKVHLGDLPRANISEKTEMILGSSVGMIFGALLGLCAGILALMFPPWYVPAYKSTILLITTAIGALSGAVWTGMVAVVLPSRKLRQFKSELEQGKVLMILRIPFHRSGTIRRMIRSRHPKAGYVGTWPMEHKVFP